MNNKLNYFSSIKFLSKYINKHKRNFIMFYIGCFVNMIISIIIPVLFGIMINEIVYYQNIFIFIRLSIMLVFILIYLCLLYFLIYAQHHYLSSIYTLDIKRDVFKHMQKCNAQYMTDASAGDIITILQFYSNECMHFVIRNIIHFINDIIKIVFIVIYLLIINWQIGLFILFAAPLTVFINAKFGKKIRNYGDKERECYNKYISWMYEILTALRDVRLLGAQQKTYQTFEDNHRKMFSVNIKSGISTINASNIIKLINLLVQLSIFTFAGYLATSGNMSIGLLIINIGFYSMLTYQINEVSQYYLDAQNRISYIQHIYDFLHSPTENEWNGKENLNITSGNINFKNINFAYEKRTLVLNNFNLSISAGEHVALIGKSGCGKSTLAYMLIGFYCPQQGEIYIDGQKLSECSLKSIRQNIGLVAQDILIFDGSIKDNILLGNKKATDDEIISACRQAGLYEFIEELPDGIDTVIGTQGVGLSGGQKQRIAIARIYIKNPKIIIFDEATSSLDSETEEAIHAAWKNVLARRTSIVIAHRQSSVMLCEKAAILENGNIIETGMPSKMIRESMAFKALFAVKEIDENA